MTNRSIGPHHKILLATLARLERCSSAHGEHKRRNDGGYTLVALLALMTVLALFAMAAAPSIVQQAQREREVEAIFRGEQMAEAIRLYYSYQQNRTGPTDASLPASIDDLLEGVSRGTKKLQILRPSAARDPLANGDEWRLVRPRSNELSDFQRALMLYAENIRPVTNDPQLKQVEQLMAPPVLPTLGIASSPVGSGAGVVSSGPFIGVTSSSQNKSVINYYGISRHNEWVFTPLFR